MGNSSSLVSTAAVSIVGRPGAGPVPRPAFIPATGRAGVGRAGVTRAGVALPAVDDDAVLKPAAGAFRTTAEDGRKAEAGDGAACGREVENEYEDEDEETAAFTGLFPATFCRVAGISASLCVPSTISLNEDISRRISCDWAVNSCEAAALSSALAALVWVTVLI